LALLIWLVIGSVNIGENSQMWPWYLLKILGNLKQSINTFKCHSPIEAMFKDCQTGGYNQRLNSLILRNSHCLKLRLLAGAKN